MFGKSIRLARVFGISIELDLSWFIIFFLVVWSLSRGYFPYYYPDISGERYVLMGVIAAFLLFMSVLLHELSHSLIALRNKLPISRITLFIFGGVAQMDEEPKTPGVEFRVALAGPVCSLILMALFHFLSTLSSEGGEAFAVFSYASFINGFLAFFNLIPGFPLDGGRLLRSALWRFSGNFKSSTLIASRVGKGFAFFLMAAGFLQAMSGSTFNGLWLILIGYFLQNAAEGSYRQVVIKEFLAGLTVGKVMNRQVISVTKDITIDKLVDDFFVTYHRNNFPVLDGERVIGIIRMSDVKKVPADERGAVTVAELMDEDISGHLIRATDVVEEILGMMVRDSLGWFIVIEGDNIVKGILTRSDIMHLLQIKSGLEG